MINPQWLELPVSRTDFHGPKDVRAIEVRLYMLIFLLKNARSFCNVCELDIIPISFVCHHWQWPILINCVMFYEGRSFNVVIGVLQGALLIPFTFRLLQPFEVFSLDGNTLFKSRNPFCKGREVGLFWYTLKTLVNCTTKCTSGFITSTRKGFL